MDKQEDEGVEEVSRRRSKNPTKAISITLPLALIHDIDDKLTRTQSRSAWIANACTLHLHDDGVNIPTRQLMAMMAARTDDEVLKTLLYSKLTQ